MKLAYKSIIGLVIICLSVILVTVYAQTVTKKTAEHKVIYTFQINEEIGPSMWRLTQKCFKEAYLKKADLIIVQMNTYGGLLDAADSISTKILESKIPVYIFIQHNAASAGALISIAADSIFMSKGSSIGAAAVVNEKGEVLPEKYQSYMRSMMRRNAESHGKIKIINGLDTTIKWFRDPLIAEGMVDPRINIPGLDSGKIVTFTCSEAIKFGYCEGEASSIQEVIKEIGITDYEIIEYIRSGLDNFIGFLINPVLQGILIMLIVGGIYFEMQSPGTMVPIGISGLAAVVYFAPLYLEGIAANWEILIFIIGVILLIIEIFAIPGFGVTGITGIILIIAGLALSMVDDVSFEWNAAYIFKQMFKSFAIVTASLVISLSLSIYLGKEMLLSKTFSFMVLDSQLQKQDSFVSADNQHNNFVGQIGVTATMLRPSGKVEINGDVYDATCDVGFIERGETVQVMRFEAGQLYVKKVNKA